MKNVVKIIVVFGLISFLMSCSSNNPNENNLTPQGIEYIKTTCALDKDETILLFETNAGFRGYKHGGNFITNKRVEGYWIENEEKSVDSANYQEIDSIKLNDRITAITLASSLSIYKSNGTKFELYIEADSSRLYSFYTKTIEVWNENKRQK